MELEDCTYCEQFPPPGHLPSLKVVKITGMVNVKSIGAEFYGLIDVDGQSSSSGSSLTLTAPIVFPKLRELTLRELTSLEEWSEPANLSNHSSTVCPLLEKFEVEQCPKLKRLLNGITSNHEHLHRLEVALCDSLDCLPEGVGGFQSLENLEIRGLPSLSKLYMGHCRNLTSLTIHSGMDFAGMALGGVGGFELDPTSSNPSWASSISFSFVVSWVLCLL